MAAICPAIKLIAKQIIDRVVLALTQLCFRVNTNKLDIEPKRKQWG